MISLLRSCCSAIVTWARPTVVAPSQRSWFTDENPLHRELAFGLATNANLFKSLPCLLAPFQHQLRLEFADDSPCELYLYLPWDRADWPTWLAVSAKEPRLPGAAEEKSANSSMARIPDITRDIGNEPPLSRLRIERKIRGLISQVQPRLDSLSSVPLDPLHLSTASQSFYAQGLNLGNNLQAWLVLEFAGQMPSLSRIEQLLRPLSEALQQGLGAWLEQQERIQQAVEQERLAQAAELHDSVAQTLGYLRMRAAKFESLCQAEAYAPLRELSADLASQTHGAYQQTRELIACSRMSMHRKSLAQGINEAVEEFQQLSSVIFELDNRLASEPFSAKARVEILFIVREVLSNIVRHAHASHARLVLRQIKHWAHIKIEDNGIGIEQRRPRKDSFGLQIMQQRAEKIHAELQIQPRKQGGTLVELTVPLALNT